MKQNSGQPAWKKWLPWVFFAACISAWVAYFVTRIGALVDSDMSSEMILGNILFQENGFLLTKNWFYSTEIRLLHQQAVFSLLFRLTDDWQTVRIAGTLILYAAYLAAWYYFCCRAGIRKYFPVTGGLLMLPLSEAYSYIMLLGAFYIPHVVLALVIVGLALGLMQEKKGRMRRSILLMALSLLAGLGGPRLILVVFAPLGTLALMRLVLRRSKADAPFAGVTFGACGLALAGYVINAKVLTRQYNCSFTSEYTAIRSYSNPASVQIEIPSLSDVKDVALGWLRSLSDDRAGMFRLVALAVLLAAAAAIIVVLIRRKEASEAQKFSALFGFLSAAWLTLVFLFTDMERNTWYFVPSLIFLLPAFCAFLQLCPLRHILALAMTAVLLLCGVRGYDNLALWRERTGRISDDTKQVAQFLEDNGYREGYASFWSANVVTELTDGQVDVWCPLIGDPQPVTEYIFKPQYISQWLQPVMHTKRRPEGKVFVLLTAKENKTATLVELPGVSVVYQSDDYVIYDVAELPEVIPSE